MEEKKKKKRKYIRVAGYENRKPYGMRKDGLHEVIDSVQAGEILELSQEEWYVPSLRSYAALLNTQAGWRKYSVSVNRMLNKVYIRNNDGIDKNANN